MPYYYLQVSNVWYLLNHVHYTLFLDAELTSGTLFQPKDLKYHKGEKQMRKSAPSELTSEYDREASLLCIGKLSCVVDCWVISAPLCGGPRGLLPPRPLTPVETELISSRPQLLKTLLSCSLTPSLMLPLGIVLPAVYIYLSLKPQQLQKQIRICYATLCVEAGKVLCYLSYLDISFCKQVFNIF